MLTVHSHPSNIDAYIAGFPEGTQQLLKQLRAAIRKAAPEAAEKISYGMPTFTLQGNLVHFAAYKNHIGLYPTPSGVKAFAEALSAYKGAKASIQFPIDKPLPLNLITQMVQFRVQENLQKADIKKQAQKKGFLSLLAAPARRALENKGITTLQQLSTFSEAEITALHGMGPGALPKLRRALEEAELSFKTQ